MDEMIVLTSLSAAALAFAALTLIPVALRTTGAWFSAVLTVLSILPAAYAVFAYLSYSPVAGGARSLGAIFWTALPTLIALIFRAVFKFYPALRSAVVWKYAAIVSILMPILIAWVLFGYAFLNWKGW
jgi:hypothetical protein